MKKLILALFLILGAISFGAIPNHIDAQKFKKAGYEISEESENGFRIIKKKDNGEIVLIMYYLNEVDDNMAKDLAEMSIETAPEEFEFLESTETKRAYINKFVGPENRGVYNYVAKKSKIKGCHPVIMHITRNQLSNNQLLKVSESLLNEAESYLK